MKSERTQKKNTKAGPAALRKKKKDKAVKETQAERQPYIKRMIFGEEKPDLAELEAGSTTILDILAPTTVDTKSKDYIVVDGVYHTYLYITGYGYSTTVGSCWLAPLVEAGEGINISFLNINIGNYAAADSFNVRCLYRLIPTNYPTPLTNINEKNIVHTKIAHTVIVIGGKQ